MSVIISSTNNNYYPSTTTLSTLMQHQGQSIRSAVSVAANHRQTIHELPSLTCTVRLSTLMQHQGQSVRYAVSVTANHGYIMNKCLSLIYYHVCIIIDPIAVNIVLSMQYRTMTLNDSRSKMIQNRYTIHDSHTLTHYPWTDYQYFASLMNRLMTEHR